MFCLLWLIAFGFLLYFRLLNSEQKESLLELPNRLSLWWYRLDYNLLRTTRTLLRHRRRDELIRNRRRFWFRRRLRKISQRRWNCSRTLLRDRFGGEHGVGRRIGDRWRLNDLLRRWWWNDWCLPWWTRSGCWRRNWRRRRCDQCGLLLLLERLERQIHRRQQTGRHAHASKDIAKWDLVTHRDVLGGRLKRGVDDCHRCRVLA